LRFAVVGDLGMFGSDMKLHLELADHDVSGFNRSNMDLESSEKSLTSLLEGFDVVVNALAYTAVDKAEQEPELANLINGDFAGKLARVSAMNESKFMHISTDYVFDGSSDSPVTPLESLRPINAYGRSKALGENLVADSGADFVILRTSWLYGRNGKCFPRSIADKLLNGHGVSVVDDQVGQPTWTSDLARIVLAHSLNSFGERVVHAVSSGETSWYEFALAIRDSMKLAGVPEIRPVRSSEYQTIATRPSYSVLENMHTQGPVLENWLERWKVAAPEVLESPQEAM
jgi:dTDP-4-dehydrorhamnose reductase